MSLRFYFFLVIFRLAAVSQGEEGVLAAESLVKALQLGAFDCHQFENPVLQRYGQHARHLLYMCTLTLSSWEALVSCVFPKV